MTKAFDAIDRFCGAHLSGRLGWVVTAASLVAIAVLGRITHSDRPMLLLAIPGIYMMWRSGGAVQIVKFGLCILLMIVILAPLFNLVPCDGWGQGFRMFYKIECR